MKAPAREEREERQVVEVSEDLASPGALTTAQYLARRMCAEKGYAPGTAEEAQGLADAADLVLTKATGMSFLVVCIIDREAHPEKTFGLSREQIVEIGKACLRYTGTVNRTKLPVGVQVWEVGAGAAGPDTMRRLKGLSRSMPGRARVVISGWGLDPDRGEVQTTAPLSGLFVGRPYLTRALREPRLPEDEIVRPVDAAVRADAGRPWATIALTAALTLVFLGELLFAVGARDRVATPNVLTLLAWGALLRAQVDSGEWYRLITAAFLHADPLHLICNGVALVMAGAVLEALLGRAWLLALFVLGALGGSVLSLVLNAPETLSVGASGAIMGMLAAAIIVVQRLASEGARLNIQMRLLYVLVPSLLPLATRGGRIDYAGHLGGALVGALVGWLILRSWPRDEPLPRRRQLALAVALTGLALLLFGVVQQLRHRAVYQQAAAIAAYQPLLIPDAQLPASKELAVAESADLVARFPRDPRARLVHALALARTGDLAAAQAELRAGLAEPDLLTTMFEGRVLEIKLRTFLVSLLLRDGKHGEAQEAALPVCTAGDDGGVPALLRDLDVCR